MVAASALAFAGCSMLPDLDPMPTGSVQPVASESDVPNGVAPDDWASARLALVEALGDAEAAPSIPWENHVSATRGTVTPLNVASSTSSNRCRGFLMSFVKASNEAWLEGEACRTAKGSWKVDQARMLDRT